MEKQVAEGRKFKSEVAVVHSLQIAILWFATGLHPTRPIESSESAGPIQICRSSRWVSCSNLSATAYLVLKYWRGPGRNPCYKQVMPDFA